ncbi:MAG TPA: hypothetical protein VHO24_16765 [Opitutaceae bacterium]|nr:hypothetical protein [Opitutaceae bacterium]
MSTPAIDRRGWGFLFCCAVLLLAGCSSVTTRSDPKADLTRFRRFYVERRLGDDHRIDELIVQQLQNLGREASSGPLTMKPEGIDAIVTYTDRWEWDFKTYLIELNLAVRDGRNDKLVTVARYYQPSLKTRPPAEMIREILTPLFPAGDKPAKK